MERLLGKLTVSCKIELIWLALTFSALWFVVLDYELPEAAVTTMRRPPALLRQLQTAAS